MKAQIGVHANQLQSWWQACSKTADGNIEVKGNKKHRGDGLHSSAVEQIGMHSPDLPLQKGSHPQQQCSRG